MIDFGMNIQKALSAPRLSFIEPDTIAIEEGIPERTRSALAAMGHKIRVVKRPDGLGNAHGLTIDYGDDGRPARFRCGSRGNGLAQGY